MKLKSNKAFQFLPILITIAIYLVILIALNLIYIDYSNNLSNDDVVIEWIEIERKVIVQKSLSNVTKETKPKKTKQKTIIKAQDKLSKTEIFEVISDSIIMYEQDSIKKKSSWLDSMVVANPNLSLLKYATTEYLKNNPILKSDSVKIAEGIRSFMQDYYKSKYPTPVYKFGNNPQGIAIDDIINIFKSDDVDEDKIKKYLKIGKYK